MADDYYQVLGVPHNASQAEIQKAYREMARKHHPDMNPGDKSAKKKFQKIQAAFDVLNDPKKREMYDRYGSSFETMGRGPQPGAAPWGPGAGPGFPGGAGGEDVDFSQFFGERFGGGPEGGPAPGVGGFADLFNQFRRGAAGRGKAGSARARRGADLVHELTIPFATAILGGEVQLSVSRPSGSVETITVKIPAGIEEGKKIRLRGQGEPVAGGGTPGDILLTVRVQPHPFFHREGKNLHVRVPVTLAEAALGATVDVPTPKGTVGVHVPPGTSSGTKLRIRGQGVGSRNGAAGDLLAEIQIAIPKQLDDADKEAIRQIDARHPLAPRANLRW
jgi:DnaJ-class molecular chaperone